MNPGPGRLAKLGQAFQFLIGRLESHGNGSQEPKEDKFQFLIGRLESEEVLREECA